MPNNVKLASAMCLWAALGVSLCFPSSATTAEARRFEQWVEPSPKRDGDGLLRGTNGRSDGEVRTLATLELADGATTHPFLIDLPPSMEGFVECISAAPKPSATPAASTPPPLATNAADGSSGDPEVGASVLTLRFTNVPSDLYAQFADHDKQQGAQWQYAHLSPNERPATTFRPLRSNSVSLCGAKSVVMLLNTTRLLAEGDAGRSVVVVGTVVPFFYALDPDSGAGSLELRQFGADTTSSSDANDLAVNSVIPEANVSADLTAAIEGFLAKHRAREASGAQRHSFKAAADASMNWLGPLDTFDISRSNTITFMINGQCTPTADSYTYFCMASANPARNYACLTRSNYITSLTTVGTLAGTSSVIYSTIIPSESLSYSDAYAYPYVSVVCQEGTTVTTYGPWASMTVNGIVSETPSGFASYSPANTLRWSVFVPTGPYASTSCPLTKNARITLYHGSMVHSLNDAAVWSSTTAFACSSASGGYRCSIDVPLSSIGAVWWDLASVPNPFFYLVAEGFVCQPGSWYNSNADYYSPQFFLSQGARFNFQGKVLLDTKMSTVVNCASPSSDLGGVAKVVCGIIGRTGGYAFDASIYAAVSGRSSSDNTVSAPLVAQMEVSRLYWDTSKNFYIRATATSRGTLYFTMNADMQGDLSFPFYSVSIMDSAFSLSFPVVGDIAFSAVLKAAASAQIYGDASISASAYVTMDFDVSLNYEPSKAPSVDVTGYPSLKDTTFAGQFTVNIRPSVTFNFDFTVGTYIVLKMDAEAYALLTARGEYPYLPAMTDPASPPACQLSHPLDTTYIMGYSYAGQASSSITGTSYRPSGSSVIGKPYYWCSGPNSQITPANPLGLPTYQNAAPIRAVIRTSVAATTDQTRATTAIQNAMTDLKGGLLKALSQRLGNSGIASSAVQMVMSKLGTNSAAHRGFIGQSADTVEGEVYLYSTGYTLAASMLPITVNGPSGYSLVLNPYVPPTESTTTATTTVTAPTTTVTAPTTTMTAPTTTMTAPTATMTAPTTTMTAPTTTMTAPTTTMTAPTTTMTAPTTTMTAPTTTVTAPTTAMTAPTTTMTATTTDPSQNGGGGDANDDSSESGTSMTGIIIGAAVGGGGAITIAAIIVGVLLWRRSQQGAATRQAPTDAYAYSNNNLVQLNEQMVTPAMRLDGQMMPPPMEKEAPL